MSKSVRIKGARENNLQNISVEIPRDKLTVITGVSGSGKSSLAFDVLYGEGQRRFMESLSAYARSRIPLVKRPDVDSVKGLSPVLSISQARGVRNPRSTVGTLTEIQTYLRLLFAAIGIPHCPYCDTEIKSKTPHQIAEHIQSLPEGTTIEILAPFFKIYGENWEYLIDIIRNHGCRNIRLDDELKSTSDKLDLDEDEEYRIEGIVDKFTVNGDQTKDIVASIIDCVRIGEGLVRLNIQNPENLTSSPDSFYKHLSCPEHHILAGDFLPWYFSANEGDSWCHTCGGLGTHRTAIPTLMIVNPDKSLREGAIDRGSFNIDTSTFKRIINWRYVIAYSMGEHFGFSLDTPFKDLPEDIQNKFFYGTDGEKFKLLKPPDEKRDHENFGKEFSFRGIVARLDAFYRKLCREGKQHDPGYSWVEKRMVESLCPDCKGTKLLPQRMLVRINDKNIHELASLPLVDLRKFVDGIKPGKDKEQIAEPILEELKKRIDLMLEIGLYYLSLNRRADTISGGELQRTRLSTQIGSELMGMLVVLDEPSIGLHPRDGKKVIDTLKKLRDVGNTVIVVEHDVDTMKAADNIIEMGPGPGVHGGTVVAQGLIDDIMDTDNSITGQYLRGAKKITIPEKRRKSNGHSINIFSARENNLKKVDVELPLGLFLCITGVSGSGKSSLINEVLYKKLHSIFRDRRIIPGKHDLIEGIENLRDVRNIDQTPIGRSSRSNPATYVGFSDKIREIFANLPASKEKNYEMSEFSFNQNSGGRCPECKGEGIVTTEMQFMPDIESVCPACKGARFTKEILEIKFKDKSIADVLDLTVEEAIPFFEDVNLIHHKLKTMDELGLGYLKLGQPSNQLSGGESQRIKLAKELGKIKASHDTLYIFDEPTTGLHLADIQKLLDCLNRLVDQGNTVLVIEHHLDVIKSADYVIDLGPSGGDEGGEIVAIGTPEEVSKVNRSFTGQYLKELLEEV
ncbi:MAG: excinuclease ABC subunit UvrA [Candidatus Thorarchaeota archaeon]